MSPAVLLLAAVCSAAAALPEGDAYVRGLLGAQRAREEALSRYTYDVHERREELDGEGRVRKRRSRDYEVFVVKGRPVRRLVRENGRPLDSAAQAKEERRARELAEALAAGRAVRELPGVRIAQLIERYRFTAAGREELDGRCALVFDFEALPGERPLARDALLRRLAGRLWVDEEEQAVARVELGNSSSVKLGLGALASVREIRLRSEFRRLEPGVWLPRVLETFAAGRKLLLRHFRVRTTVVYDGYRRFEIDVGESVR